MSLPWGACQLQESPAPSRTCAALILAAPHLLTVFSTGAGLSGAASRRAWLTCRALHTCELRLAHCRGVSPSLFFRVTSESRDRKRLHREQGAGHSALQSKTQRQDARSTPTQCKQDPPPAPRRHSPRPGASSHHEDTASSPQALSFTGRAQKPGMASDFSQLFH